jgi:hypothetical protein
MIQRKALASAALPALLALAFFAFLEAQSPAAPSAGTQDLRLPVVSEAGTWGFCDERGLIVIPPEFDEVRDFSEGLAAVKFKGLWGFIDAAGRKVLPFSFQGAKEFSGGLAPVKQGGLWGYAGRDGKIRIKCAWYDAAPLSEGLARVRGQKLWGFVNASGALAVKAVYAEARDFSSGRALVSSGGAHSFVDAAGKPLFAALKLQDAKPFSEGLAPAKADGKWGFIDPDGAWRVTPRFEDALGYSVSLAPVKQAGKWGYADRTGALYFAPAWDEALPFSESVAAVRTGVRWGGLDIYGRLAIHLQHRSGFSFHGGIAKISGDKKESFYYIDQGGRIVTPGGKDEANYDYDFAKDSGNFTLGPSWKQNGSSVDFSDKDQSVFLTAWCNANVYDEYSVSTLATLRDGMADQGCGLGFNYADANDYSTFEVNMAGFFRVSRKSAGSWEDLVPWKKSPAVKKDGDNELKVIVGRYAIEFLVNGQLVASLYRGDSVIRGYVNAGLAASGGVRCSFKGFALAELSESEAALVGQRGIDRDYGFSSLSGDPGAQASAAPIVEGFARATGAVLATAGSGPADPSRVWAAPETYFSGALAKATLRIPASGGAAGLVFRYISEQTYYSFVVYADGSYSLSKRVNGVETDLIPKTAGGKIAAVAPGSDLAAGVDIGVATSRMGWTLLAAGKVLESRPDPLESDAYQQFGLEVDSGSVTFASFAVAEYPALESDNAFDSEGRLMIPAGAKYGFSNPDDSRGLGQSTYFRLVGGSLVCMGRSDGRFSVNLADSRLDPFKGLSIRAKFDSGNPESGLGIVFRYENMDDFCYLELSGSGKARLVRSVKGGWTELAPWAKVSGKPGDWVTLSVVMDGNRARCLANGTELFSADLGEPHGKTPRFGVGAAPQVAGRFDDLSFQQ